MSGPITIEEGVRFAVPFKADSHPQIDHEKLQDWNLSLPDDVTFPRLELKPGINIKSGAEGSMYLKITNVGSSNSGAVRYVQAKVIDVEIRNKPQEEKHRERRGLGYRSNLHYTGNDLAGPTSTAQKSNSDRPI